MSQGMTHGLSQGLTQGLTMTPQLVQSIKLLQMSSAELLKHVEEEVEKNPLLEISEVTLPGSQDGISTRDDAEPAHEAGVSIDLDVSQSLAL